MRLRWTGLIIVFGFLVLSCSVASDLVEGFFNTSETGPRFVNLRANEQQQIQRDLESNPSGYFIYYIPEHAALFDPIDDGNKLEVGNPWIKSGDDKRAWVEILRQNTQTKDSVLDKVFRTTTGFLEIIGPDEQSFGYLVYDKMDMVTLKITDQNTMRIYYYPQREGGR